MKKIFYFLITMSLITSLFTACHIFKKTASKPNIVTYNESVKTENVTDESVIINGVKWATHNVDMPGTFAATPESTGMLYQWNRKDAWNLTNFRIDNWDSSIPKGTKWEKENDPSPKGWRIPTFDEIKTLLDSGKVNNEWITQNGVSGMKFTDKITGNSLFFPAIRNRLVNGILSGGVVTSGYYWASTPFEDDEKYAYILSISSFKLDGAKWNSFARIYGFGIRCVAE